MSLRKKFYKYCKTGSKTSSFFAKKIGKIEDKKGLNKKIMINKHFI